MGDRSYMTITVHDCPVKRRKVAEVLASYDLTPNLWDAETETFASVPDEVEVGEPYDVDEISLGSETEVAGELIARAPRISFTIRQEPHYTAPGGIVCYTPKLGRFDGMVDTEGVTLTVRGVLDLIGEAEQAGYLDRDTILRQNKTSLSGRQLAEWQQQPGLRELVEVEGGIPWEQDWRKVPRWKRRAWLAVIDRRWAEGWERGQEGLREHAAELGEFGLTGHADAIRAASTPDEQFTLVRTAATQAEADLKEAAAAQETRSYWDLPHGHLPGALKAWASVWETAWQGRRRP